MVIYLGVDLGLAGALAGLDPNGTCGLLEDMPTIPIAVGKRTRRTYHLGALLTLCPNGPNVTVVLEDIYHLGFRGSLAARSAGVGWGLFTMLAALRGWPLVAVAPTRWQRVMLEGRARGKGASIARAAELFPNVSLGKPPKDGRADALLLAVYGLRTVGR